MGVRATPRCRQCRRDRKKCVMPAEADYCERCTALGFDCEDYGWPALRTPEMKEAANTFLDSEQLMGSNTGETRVESGYNYIVRDISGTTATRVPVPIDAEYTSLNSTKQTHTDDMSQEATSEISTVYSAASVETTRRDRISQMFAEKLFRDVGGGILQSSDLSTVPKLLGDFALRLGQTCSNPEAKDAMVFIYRYRSELSKSFQLLISESQENEERPEKQRINNDIPIEDRLWPWLNDLDPDGRPDVEPENVEDDSQTEWLTSIQDFDDYSELVSRNCSYAWLLANLRNKALLSKSEDDVLGSIRETVLQALPKTLDLQSQVTPLFRTIFEVSWPIWRFLEDQFRDNESRDIGHIITITGSMTDAQASTIEQYMEQTWPCTGNYLVCLLRKVVGAPGNQEQYCRRPDGTRLEAYFEHFGDLETSSLKVIVSGTQSVIAEVAEQLAWLSAAFRTSPQVYMHPTFISGKYYICKPSILPISRHAIDDTVESFRDVEAHSERARVSGAKRYEDRPLNAPNMAGREISPESTYCFKIQSGLQELGYVEKAGSCSVRIIRSVVMVHGFPIRCRTQKHLGLEICLRTAAELVGTQYINEFAGTTFIKRHSVMLVPVLQVDDVLVWHLCVSSFGEYLSYLDHNCPTPLRIRIEDIGKFRHIVGWCSWALNYAGAVDGQYAVHHANLPKATVGCVLADSDISFRKTLADDAPVSIPRQLQTKYVHTDGYSSMFKYLSQRFVLLWDKNDQRGWLVNGVTALLHLLRSSLHLEEKSALNAFFVLKPSDLEEPGQPHAADAAYRFFGKLNNLRVRVSVKRVDTLTPHDKSDQSHDEYEILNERVSRFFEVLEKAFSYSEKLRDAAIVTGKGDAPARLEGWDFFRIASEAERTDACTVSLPDIGRSWLQLVQSIGVVTLFGQGFGEVIKPSSAACCEGWTTLPKGRYYLAVNTADVRKIMECYGDLYAKPMCLSGSIIWHNPSSAFENCGCKESGQPGTKLVQQPCSNPTTCSCSPVGRPGFGSDTSFCETGAVVFGHSSAYGPLSTEGANEDFRDSGLGSSLGIATSRSIDLTTPPTSSRLPIQTGPDRRSYGDGHISGGSGHWGDRYHNEVHHHYSAPVYASQGSATPGRLSRFRESISRLMGARSNYSSLQISAAFIAASQPDQTTAGSESRSSQNQ